MRNRDSGQEASSTPSPTIEEELDRASATDRQAFLEQYADEYIRLHIDRIIEDNYRQIKNDIADILEAHGVSLDADTGDTGHDEDEENGQDDEASPATADGITEEWEPDPVIPVDDEWVE